ncbi:SPARC-related modular calcium-binding protein 2 isoform X2 [Drosophila grimshawi]|uniref:SPARC-related modular calcium-binding protein 2 isoform X2 n=1 Tax=Drosophila grimshawi TaxID=7222 RepID=UPI000C871606|nr:SPARC-related modular calcium-binding protein 2 isoform X2 [Drosophila grimshawi]
MFVRCFLITLCVLVLLQLATGSRSPKQQEPQHELPLSPSQSQSLSKCAAKQGECDESEGPVCGTDDQTYPTRCHLQRVQCSGHQVSLKHRGNCKGCLGALQYAHRESARNPKIFIPRCRNDGNYAAMQCLGDTGCWCSDSSGNPIKNTSTRRGRPKCAVYRRNNRRRSPTRLFSLDAEAANSSDGGGNGGHRPCSKADRRAFNNHLIEVFRSEQVRSGQPQAAGANDDSVLDWKFAQLDANANQVLERQEVRELKKLVKRAVKPKRCGRAFGKYCDVNKDDNLSRVEWSNCLAKDASQRKAGLNILNSSPTSSSIPHTTSTTIPRRPHYTNLHNIHHTNTHHDHTNTNVIGTSSSSSSSSGSSIGSRVEFGNDSEEHEDDYVGEDEDASMTHSRTSPLSPSSFNFLNAKPEEATNNESEGDANCWTDREVAREEQRHGGNRSFYVPECMSDGRYKRVQCYSSFCWCVHEETGKNIPGTFGQKRPQCDEVSAANRPMKGCTEPRKTQFLKELKEFLNTNILPSSNTGNSTMWKSEDERIATLSFVFLDKNKNKSWERKEWKVFRDLVTNASNLSKCGKKMPRYCDVNGDKKISLSEWVNCLQSHRMETTTTAKPAQSNETATSRLLGSNPLEQYLKDY